MKDSNRQDGFGGNEIGMFLRNTNGVGRDMPPLKGLKNWFGTNDPSLRPLLTVNAEARP